VSAEPTASFDARFSAPAAGPAAWSDVRRLLEEAELYWLTTVRRDGRPHVTPLVAVTADGTMHFTTGLSEQKARNLEHNAHVALTTGANAWQEGTDVVVEGTAVRVTARDDLERVAAAYEAKYRGEWDFEVGDGVLHHHGATDVAVFRIAPAKVLAFAKDPHGQTTFRF
jgi:general stress protein 26